MLPTIFLSAPLFRKSPPHNFPHLYNHLPTCQNIPHSNNITRGKENHDTPMNLNATTVHGANSKYIGSGASTRSGSQTLFPFRLFIPWVYTNSERMYLSIVLFRLSMFAEPYPLRKRNAPDNSDLLADCAVPSSKATHRKRVTMNSRIARNMNIYHYMSSWEEYDLYSFALPCRLRVQTDPSFPLGPGRFLAGLHAQRGMTRL